MLLVLDYFGQFFNPIGFNLTPWITKISVLASIFARKIFQITMISYFYRLCLNSNARFFSNYCDILFSCGLRLTFLKLINLYFYRVPVGIWFHGTFQFSIPFIQITLWTRIIRIGYTQLPTVSSRLLRSWFFFNVLYWTNVLPRLVEVDGYIGWVLSVHSFTYANASINRLAVNCAFYELEFMNNNSIGSSWPAILFPFLSFQNDNFRSHFVQNVRSVRMFDMLYFTKVPSNASTFFWFRKIEKFLAS